MKFASKFLRTRSVAQPRLLLPNPLLKFSDLNLLLEFRFLKFERSKFRTQIRFETARLKFYSLNSPLKPRGKQDAVCRPACRIIAHRRSRVNFGKFHRVPNYLNLRLKFRCLGFAAKPIRRFAL
ncbi:hypothetical protein [uncultured Campylobacter sp.]|uniref:hypothetical protein n=1 Tax=uncultured Campylobacter sp. TaxID=218934 RepID=UPI0026160E4B|nr:hypothetical protein [uncultured Campylobacter sp.]